MVPVMEQAALMVVSLALLAWALRHIWAVVGDLDYDPSRHQASLLAWKYYAPVATWNVFVLLFVWLYGEEWVGRSVVLIVFAVIAAPIIIVIGLDIAAWPERIKALKAARQKSRDNH